jgi:hypothetical protein
MTISSEIVFGALALVSLVLYIQRRRARLDAQNAQE